MCSKNRINHNTKHHTWTPGFFRWKPKSGENHRCSCSAFNIFIIEKTCYNICAGADLTNTQAPTCAHLPSSPGRELRPPDSFTSLSWKGATTPRSRLPASPWRELRPPDLIYQPHLEGSYNPLTEGYNPQHLYRPRFINFHTGSKASFRTPLAGHVSSYFQTGPIPYN